MERRRITSEKRDLGIEEQRVGRVRVQAVAPRYAPIVGLVATPIAWIGLGCYAALRVLDRLSRPRYGVVTTYPDDQIEED